jgi:integrase
VTKRSHGEGSIQARGPNSFRIRYRINGKRFEKTIQGTKSDAAKALRSALKDGDDGKHVAPDRITLKEWSEQWLALLERKPIEGKSKRKRGLVSARTLERYSDLLRLHVWPTLGDRCLQKLTATEIDDLYIEREQVLAPRTVHHIHVALKACLAAAVRKKVIAANPADDAEAPTFEDGEAGTVLDPAQLAVVLAGFKGRAIYPIILTIALTGARLNEVLALRWIDVNFEAKTLSITRAIEPTKAHGRRIKAPKTSRGVRTITIDDALLSVLRKVRDKQLRLVAGVPNGVDVSLVRLPESALIFPGGDGSDLLRTRNHHTVENDFRERVDKIGFVGFRIHDLRGTHSTMLLDAGVPVHVVAARIGDDPATLLRIYAKRTRKADANAASVIAALSANLFGANLGPAAAADAVCSPAQLPPSG